jgi:uroporphyrinogen-III decarboxylase
MEDFFSFQKGLQRFEAAMKGIPDRVPVCTQIHEFVMEELGANAKEFYTTPELLPTGTLKIMEKYGVDVPVLDYDVYNIEAEALGQKIIYSDHFMPDVDRTKPLIRSRDDLRKIKTPDFETDGRFALVVEMNTIFHNLIGSEKTTLNFCAPFSLAGNIMGIEQLIMEIYNDPAFVRELFDRLTEEVLVPWILHLKNKFPDSNSICGSDASGSLPIVNPAIIKEWIVPYLLRLRKLCGPDIYVPNWAGESYLKNPEELLDIKIEVCPGFVEGQDPDVEKLGPAFYKAYAEKKNLPLILGVGASFLTFSTPEQVADRVKHYVEVGGENGRFALYLCNLGATTPPANVKAAVEAAHTYGSYE